MKSFEIFSSNPRWWRFYPMLSSTSFIVLSFTFKDLWSIWSYFLYVVWVMDGSSFFKRYKHLNVPAAFVEKTAFPLNGEISFALGWKSISHMYVGLFQDFILFHCSVCIPWCHYHTLVLLFSNRKYNIMRVYCSQIRSRMVVARGWRVGGWGVTV